MASVTAPLPTATAPTATSVRSPSDPRCRRRSARAPTASWGGSPESSARRGSAGRDVGMEHIADDHPVIVVANHPNGFVDPVLVLATSPRPLRFLAKSTLWKVPGVRWLLAFAGVLPVRRAAGRGHRGQPPRVRRLRRRAGQGRCDRDLPRGHRERRAAAQAAAHRSGAHRARGQGGGRPRAADRSGRPRVRGQDPPRSRVSCGPASRSTSTMPSDSWWTRGRRRDPTITTPSTASRR